MAEVTERVLRTRRLELHAATVELAELAVGSGQALAQRLGAEPPAGWPPPLTEDTQYWLAEQLAAQPGEAGWWVWYWVTVEPAAPRQLIGQGGFKGPPGPEHTVEIGYSVVREAHGRGYATEAAGALIEWAFAHRSVDRVIAHTYRHLTASIRVMEKNGLVFLEERAEEEGLVRYIRRRSEPR
jgi:ribosomal-protein-alanine N-acetyltransferase